MFELCLSIFANNYEFCLDIVEKHEFVELRLDEGIISNAQIAEIISRGKKIISTCRNGFIPIEKRYEILNTAINQDTYYIDLEHDFEELYKNKLIEYAKIKGCKIINSYHNFNFTPDYQELIRISESLSKVSDIIKIACKVNSRNDILNLLTIYKEYEPGKIISFGLGIQGKITRLASLFMGAPFTYTSLDKTLETSEGQLEFEKLKCILDRLEFGR